MSEGYSRSRRIASTKAEKIQLMSRWLRFMDRTRKWFESYLSGCAHLIQRSQPSRSTLVFPRVLSLGPPTLLFFRRSHPGSPAIFLNIFKLLFFTFNSINNLYLIELLHVKLPTSSLLLLHSARHPTCLCDRQVSSATQPPIQ